MQQKGDLVAHKLVEVGLFFLSKCSIRTLKTNKLTKKQLKIQQTQRSYKSHA